jgi:hypothetical protein
MPTEIERRQVAYDASSGVLTVGGRTAVVTAELGDNERLLRTYLGLVAQQRDVVLGRAVHLRRADVTALSALLDLDDGDLEGQLANILQLSDEEAADLHRRLLRQRFAAAAIGVGIFAGASAAVPAAGAAEPKAVAAAEQTATVSSKAIGSPVTVHAAPLASAPDVALAPAVRHEREVPPATPEGVDIGDALTIER